MRNNTGAVAVFLSALVLSLLYCMLFINFPVFSPIFKLEKWKQKAKMGKSLFMDLGCISNLEGTKLGGHKTLRALFSLREKGHFPKIKRVLLCLLQNLGGSGGHMPPAPPGSYVYVFIQFL